MSDELLNFAESDPERVSVVLAEYFSDDVPPAGTPCAWCERWGHFCLAKRYWGGGEGVEEAAICVACAEGIDCPVVASRLLTEEQNLARFDVPAGPVRSVTPVDAAKRVVVDSSAAVRRNENGWPVGIGRISSPAEKRAREQEAEARRERYEQTTPKAYSQPEPDSEPERAEVAEKQAKAPAAKPVPKEREAMPIAGTVTEAVKEQIRAANLAESASLLAKRLNIPVSQVYYWRSRFRELDARKPVTKTAPKPVAAARETALAKTPSRGVPSDLVDVSERIHAMATPVAVPEPDAIEANVSITVNTSRLDAWWQALPAATKAEIALASIGA